MFGLLSLGRAPDLDEFQTLRSRLAHREPFATRSSKEGFLAANRIEDRFGGVFAWTGWLDSPEAAAPDGEFALAHFAPDGSFRILRDALGVKPLYYAVRGSTLAFAPEWKALAVLSGVDRTLRPTALADHLVPGASGLSGLDESPIRGVSSLPPAHALSWRHGRIEVAPYWDFRLDSGLRFRSFDEALEHFRPLFRNAVRKRMPAEGKLALALSGGVDSSSLLAQFAPEDRGRLVAVHFAGEGPDTDETSYLDELAARFEIDVHRIQQREIEGTSDQLWSHVQWAEAPSMDGIWPHFDRLCGDSASLGARRLITGHWGDQLLWDTAHLRDFVARDPVGAADHLFRLRRRMGGPWFTAQLRHLFREALREIVPDSLLRFRRRKRWRTGAEERVASFTREFRRASCPSSLSPTWDRGRDGSSHARSLYRQVRSRFTAYCLEWNEKMGARRGIELSFPFLDRDLVQGLMDTPPEFFSYDGVPRALAREAARAELPPRVKSRSTKADFTALTAVRAGAVFALLKSLGTERCALEARGWCAPGSFWRSAEALRSRLSRDDARPSWRLIDLVAFELFARQIEAGS